MPRGLLPMPPDAPTRAPGLVQIDDDARFAALLIGRRIRSVLVQQFWLHGELVDPANVVFLELDRAHWVRLFIDGPILFWCTVGRPKRRSAVADAEGFAFPVLDVSRPKAWAGRVVAGVTFAADPIRLVRVQLEGGGVLQLEDRDDRGLLVVGP